MKRARPDSAQSNHRVNRVANSGDSPSSASSEPPPTSSGGSPRQRNTAYADHHPQTIGALVAHQHQQPPHPNALARAQVDASNLAILSHGGPQSSVQANDLASQLIGPASYVMPHHASCHPSHPAHTPHSYANLHNMQSHLPPPPNAAGLHIPLARFGTEINALAHQVNDRMYGQGGAVNGMPGGMEQGSSMMEDEPAGAGSGGAEEGNAKKRPKAAPRTNRACLHCRRQKMRCEGADDPPCKRCRAANVDCQFERRADYLLNPEDSAWHGRVNAQLDTLTNAVLDIYRILQQPPPPGLNRDAGQLHPRAAANVVGGATQLERPGSSRGEVAHNQGLMSSALSSHPPSMFNSPNPAPPRTVPSTSQYDFAHSINTNHASSMTPLTAGSGFLPNPAMHNNLAMRNDTPTNAPSFEQYDAVFNSMQGLLPRGSQPQSPQVTDVKVAGMKREASGARRSDAISEEHSARLKAAVEGVSRPSSAAGSAPGAGVGVAGSHDSSRVASRQSSREGSVAPIIAASRLGNEQQ